MSYCNIGEDKQHILKLIDFLYCEMLRSGGDGDAIWYSRFYDIKEILPLVHEYNDGLKYKMKVDFNEEKKLISWWDNQECVLITNNEAIFKNEPEWIQCKVYY